MISQHWDPLILLQEVIPNVIAPIELQDTFVSQILRNGDIIIIPMDSSAKYIVVTTNFYFIFCLLTDGSL
jgi:hypothetical protein